MSAVYRFLESSDPAIPTQEAVMEISFKTLSLVLALLAAATASSQNRSFSNQIRRQASASGNSVNVNSQQIARIAINTATPPPAPTSKTPVVKTKSRNSSACTRRPIVNHDTQLIPPADKARWPQSKIKPGQTTCRARSHPPELAGRLNATYKTFLEKS
jgi:hypothetical protein